MMSSCACLPEVKRVLAIAVLLPVALFLLSACASKSEYNDLEVRVSALEQQLDALEIRIGGLQSNTGPSSGFSSSRTDPLTEISLRNLESRVFRLENPTPEPFQFSLGNKTLEQRVEDLEDCHHWFNPATGHGLSC